MKYRTSLHSWSSLLAIPLAMAIGSCAAPTTPASNPTLTLILPDSARAFDTVTLRAHYTDSLQPSWKFAWQFGDSSRATAKDTSITHVYDSAGTYTLQATLEDSANKTIAHQSGQLRVLPLNGPMLTFTVPDSVFWGDSCVMTISSSQPLLPSWKYIWSFGDSTTFSSQKDSALHWYVNPGTYTVRVELDDTVRHVQLGSRTATGHVVARHFNLALLQSMKYVDVSWQAFVGTGISGTDNYCTPQSGYPIKPFSWLGTNFSMDAESNWNDSSQGWLETPFRSSTQICAGNVDSDLTGIGSFYLDSSATDFSGQRSSGGFYCYATYQSSLSIGHIPFKSESDSEMVFEASGPITADGQYQSRLDGKSFSGYIVQNWAYWNEPNPPFTSSIIIRFHK